MFRQQKTRRLRQLTARGYVIDIGQERAAFLHVEDLIRPDDFETYLAGGRKHAMGENEEAPSAEDAETVAMTGDELPAVAGALAVAIPIDRPSIGEVQAEAEAIAETVPAAARVRCYCVRSPRLPSLRKLLTSKTNRSSKRRPGLKRSR